MRRVFPALVTMVFGWLTLITYLVPTFAPVRPLFVELAIIVAAFGMVLGVINVADVHATHIIRRRSGWFLSFVLLASMIIVLVVSGLEAGQAVTEKVSIERVAQAGITGPVMISVYQYVLIPIQSSLAALLPFLLAFAAFRTLRMRTAAGRIGALVFLISAFIVLAGQVPLNVPVIGPMLTPLLSSVRGWWVSVIAMAGMRGILIGVAIGVTATAMRVLIGADRPTSD